MGKRHDIDKAVRNMKNWADRSEWSDELSIVFDAHFAAVRKHADISPEEFHQNIVESDYGGMLFGIVFEDFLSRNLSPSNKNIVDDYLARRGWRESVGGRARQHGNEVPPGGRHRSAGRILNRPGNSGDSLV